MRTTGALDPRRLLPLGRRGWLIRTPGFTPEEVCQLLREGGRTERGQAVLRCVARPGDWLPPPPAGPRLPPYYHEQLTRIVFWYARGDSPEAICRRLSGFGTPGGVRRALETACGRIAARLNRCPGEYGA
jgi:hypothetical protein